MTSPKNILKIFNIFILALTIYYLYKLEDETCKCIRDWRHDFIKYASIFNIIMYVLVFIKPNILLKISNIMTLVSIAIVIIFVSYITELKNTKCDCAIAKQKNVHNILYFSYYIIAFIIIFAIISVILGKVFNL